MENKVLHGDCLELMKDIPTGSIDMILCDLPYGTTACKWDVIIPFGDLYAEYYRIIRPNGFIVLTASQPFTTKLINANIDNFSHQWIWQKEQGSTPLLANVMPMKNFEDVLVFSNEYSKFDTENKHPQREYFKNVLNFIGLKPSEIIRKIGHSVDHCFRINSNQYSLCTEKSYNKLIDTFNINKMNGFIEWHILNIENISFRKGLLKEYNLKFPRVYNPQMVEGSEYKSGGGYLKHTDAYVKGGKISNMRYPNSILKFNSGKSNSLHPTQKPVALFEYLIKTYTNEGDIVLDNCAGSGTTAIACLNTKRNYILMEKEEKYFNIINERIRKHFKDLDTQISMDLCQ